MREKKTINIAIGRRIQQFDRSTQFISTIERGLAGPSLETTIKICEVLGVSTEWILRGRMALPDAENLAAALGEKFSTLSLRQLTLISRLGDDLLALIRASEENPPLPPDP